MYIQVKHSKLKIDLKLRATCLSFTQETRYSSQGIYKFKAKKRAEQIIQIKNNIKIIKQKI